MSHTKGKLEIRGFYAVNELGRAVFDCGPAPMEDEEIKANARRLVACWNVCNGIPTKWIEGGAATIVEHAVDLVKERNELLAALRNSAEYLCELMEVWDWKQGVLSGNADGEYKDLVSAKDQVFALLDKYKESQ